VEKMNFQGMGCRRFCGQVSPQRPHWGTWGDGWLVNCERKWEEGSGNGASLFTEALLQEPRGVKEGSEDGHLFPWGPRWES